jgi:predicted N-acetyltransferase YhbS
LLQETQNVLKIIDERPGDAEAIEKLLDSAFGPKRKRKISYRYRLRVPPVADLSFVAEEDGVIAGTIRHWPILVCAPDQPASPALLLGPLAVSAEHRGSGIGAQLIEKGLTLAREAGYELVILVGDLPYYARFGFAPAGNFGIVMPYEKPERVLALPLKAGGAVAHGVIRHVDAEAGRGSGLTAA